MLGANELNSQRNGSVNSGMAGALRPSPGEPAQLPPLARLIGRELRARAELLPQIDEARWMILLDIYLAMSESRDTPFMSAAHASSAAVSTAQRYIHEMIENGLIVQRRSGQDQRIMHVSLTDKGRDMVRRALTRMMELRRRS